MKNNNMDIIDNQEPFDCIINIAKVCHEANRAYCESIGDKSQPSWDNAPEWQKDSAIKGVFFHAEHPNAKPSASHDNWLQQKESEGWSYGPVKDPERKQHPCFVPYDELPESQKIKDSLFIAVCHTLLDFYFPDGFISTDEAI